MKNLKITLTLLLAFFIFNSCSDDDAVFVSPTEFELQNRIPDPDLVDLEQHEFDHLQNVTLERGPVLTFGRFYGKCNGDETCVEIFKLRQTKLIDNSWLQEDTADNIPNADNFYKGIFVDFIGSNRVDTKVLIDKLPPELFLTGLRFNSFGLPGSSDLGGYYLEYQDSNGRKLWLVDSNRNNIPKYLRSYITLVDSKINELGSIKTND